MRRTGLILLLLWLPLQSVWAVAAAACPHELTSGGRHGAGHAHAHEHAYGHSGHAVGAADAAADTDDNPGGSAGFHCHGHGNAAAMAAGWLAVTGSRAGIVPSAYSRFVAERFLESPLRPPALHFA